MCIILISCSGDKMCGVRACVQLTGMPRSMGSTGCLKGRDSGSCLYSDSSVGIRAWRSSSGLKTEKRKKRRKKKQN